MTVRWRTMGAVAALLAATGCQSIFGFESSTDLVTCVKDDDCNTGEVCSAHACIASTCLEGGCSATTGAGDELPSPPPADVGVTDASEDRSTMADSSVSDGSDYGDRDQSERDGSDDSDSGSQTDGADGGPCSDDEAGPGACPNIAPIDLPTPCLHGAYSAEFTVIGGAAPYTWQALSLPQGLVFNAHPPGTQAPNISGTVEAAGDLTLQVVDSAQRQARRTYTLAPRDKCWLAYLSTASGPATLNLFDPVLRSARAFPVVTSNPGVIDFQFSPDGKFLAYRVNPGGPNRLRLLEIRTWIDGSLDLPGPVTQYAWSDNSLALAVAYQNGTDTFLGAFDFSGVTAANPDAGDGAISPGLDGGTGAVVWLPPPGPTLPPVQSPITWVANRHIAYSAATSAGRQKPYFVELWDKTISSPHAVGIAEYAPPLSLLPSDKGFFVVDSEATMDFYGIRGDLTASFDTYYDGVADPAGRYVALVSGTELQILPTGQNKVLPVPWPPTAGAPACPMLLAWAKDLERLACVANVADAGPGDVATPPGKVWTFDADDVAQKLNTDSIFGQYVYTVDAAYGRRRAFSPSGKWLALTTKSAMYVASTDASAHLSGTFPVEAGADPDSASGLSFSPDERLLLWQRGAQLSIVSLDLGGNWFNDFSYTDPLPAPHPCSESFINGPADWCGNVHYPGPISWSSDSRLIAALTTSGTLKTWDFDKLRTTNSSTIGIVNACEQGCSSQFAFQP